jgi:hypothetical protein
MATKVDRLADELLAAIRADLARIRALEKTRQNNWRWWESLSRERAGEIRTEMRYADEDMVRVDLDRWRGHAVSGAERKRCWRAIDKLIAAGVLERVNRWGWSERATHVRLLREVDP